MCYGTRSNKVSKSTVFGVGRTVGGGGRGCGGINGDRKKKRKEKFPFSEMEIFKQIF